MNLLIGPRAQAGFFVLSDIGAVDSAERDRKGAPAGVIFFLWFGVTGAAAGEGENILSFGDELFVVGLGVGVSAQQKLEQPEQAINTKRS